MEFDSHFLGPFIEHLKETLVNKAVVSAGRAYRMAISLIRRSPVREHRSVEISNGLRRISV